MEGKPFVQLVSLLAESLLVFAVETWFYLYFAIHPFHFGPCSCLSLPWLTCQANEHLSTLRDAPLGRHCNQVSHRSSPTWGEITATVAAHKKLTSQQMASEADSCRVLWESTGSYGSKRGNLDNGN